ncbi:thioesterase family protein [Bacteroides sp. 224]|uniref:acyl-CoA thioesterase n=1 Tax=Bacteroides sp. 224 TaxID=2302936 RepID=UPI0013D7807A|nr:acyl-CoA thioesterase [Bacteroides sp. 224]NDV63679.1 acyl-CoA thioesterase [Bacteroides sp. 224]
MSKKYVFELEFKVRDYECDLQGIVNNANYMHYLEHTRHEYLLTFGINFAALHEQGIDPVLARVNMAFKTSLRSRDEFISKLYVQKEGIRYVFHQDLFRKGDDKIILKATTDVVFLINGRLSEYEVFNQLFDSVSSQ